MEAQHILEAIRETARDLAESPDPTESAIGRAFRTIIARAERKEAIDASLNEAVKRGM